MAEHANTTPEVCPSPYTNRRRLLSALTGAAAAASVLAVAMPSDATADESPDAELLHLLARFDELERQINDTFLPPSLTLEVEEERDALRVPLVAQQAPLLDRICALRATTLAGMRARARSLALWDNEMLKAIAAGDDPDAYWDERMTIALIRDLTGEHVA